MRCTAIHFGVPVRRLARAALATATGAAAHCTPGIAPPLPSLRRCARRHSGTLGTQCGGGGSCAGMDGFTNVAYNTAAEAFIDHVQSIVDEADPPLLEDLKFGDSVLSIETPGGTFVFNKQSPKLQLWLASPVSGPHHYDMVQEEGGAVRWLSERDRHDIVDRLNEELSKELGVPLSFGPQ